MKSISLKSKNVFGKSVTTSSKREILEELKKYLTQPTGKPLVIATPNPEQIVYAQRDARFAKLLDQADVAIPDGIGLAWAAGAARIPGVELMEELVQLAATRGYPIGLIGGRGGVAVEALECLSRRWPGLTGWAMEPEKKTIQEIAKKIADSNTRLVFVGLGAPKQEVFIARLARQFQMSNVKCQIVLTSVGGAFDMIAGRLPRAPLLLRTIGLEWLWRLVREPWRWRRQLALVKFLWSVITRPS